MSSEDDIRWESIEKWGREGFAFAGRHVRTLLERAVHAPRGFQIAAAAMLCLASLTAGVLIWTPSVSHLGRDSSNSATIVYAAGGEELTRYFEENRTWVELDDVSPAVIEALIATEDRRFYEHSGIDVVRTVGAVFKTLSGETQGGSTITMQLARNVFPAFKRDPMLVRKIKEWVTAFRIEMAYPKDDILEMYLNTFPFCIRRTGSKRPPLPTSTSRRRIWVCSRRRRSSAC